KARTRRSCYLHLQAQPRVRMYRFCCPLGIWLPTPPTAFSQPLTTLSLRNDGEDEFETTLPRMPMCSAFLYRKTARRLRVGHLQAVVNTMALEQASVFRGCGPT